MSEHEKNKMHLTAVRERRELLDKVFERLNEINDLTQLIHAALMSAQDSQDKMDKISELNKQIGAISSEAFR